MSTLENNMQSADVREDRIQIVDTLTEMPHTTDPVVLPPQTTEDQLEFVQNTEPLPGPPRAFDHHSAVSTRRQNILHRHQTDVLTQPPTDASSARLAWRQVIALREENRHLRYELAEQQDELQRFLHEYSTLQASFEEEVAVIHNGYTQESAQSQNHLQILMEERNRLQDAYIQKEKRYQDLYQAFQDEVEEEARKRVNEAARVLETSPVIVPPLLREVVRTLEARARKVEDKHLLEALFLKREVQKMATQLQEERQQLATERQQLAAMQNTAREQAELRQKTLQARIRARWKVASISTSVGLLLLLLLLQYLFLFFLHVTPVSLSLFAPIILCSLLAIVFARSFTNLKHVYTGPRSNNHKGLLLRRVTDHQKHPLYILRRKR